MASVKFAAKHKAAAAVVDRVGDAAKAAAARLRSDTVVPSAAIAPTPVAGRTWLTLRSQVRPGPLPPCCLPSTPQECARAVLIPAGRKDFLARPLAAVTPDPGVSAGDRATHTC